MASKYDFHLISETAEFKVYQAMESLKTKERPDGSLPKKYAPLLPKKVNVDGIVDYFDGLDVDAITVSRSGGITVRVTRAKDDPYVETEPDVTRLETAKGGSK